MAVPNRRRSLRGTGAQAVLVMEMTVADTRCIREFARR